MFNFLVYTRPRYLAYERMRKKYKTLNSLQAFVLSEISITEDTEDRVNHADAKERRRLYLLPLSGLLVLVIMIALGIFA